MIQQPASINLPPPYHKTTLNISSQLDILKLYHRHLTLQTHLDCYPQLTNSQVYQFKQIIQKIHDSYMGKQLKVKDIQGIWPVLTFIFPFNGLQLYLIFEQLITPQPDRPTQAQIKQQQVFHPGKFFKNNNTWLQDSLFKKYIRVLERPLVSQTQTNIRKTCDLFKIIHEQSLQFHQSSIDYQQGYAKFKNQIEKRLKQELILKNSKRAMNMFSQPFLSQCVLSEPDRPSDLLANFTLDQYLKYQSYSHMRLRSQIKGVCKTVIQQIKQKIQTPRIIQQEFSQNVSTVTMKGKRAITMAHSQITKKQSIFKQKNNQKRPQRYQIIQQYYQRSPKQNLLLQDLKKERKRRQQNQKQKKKLQRVVKKCFASYSDEQGDSSRKRKRMRNVNKNKNMQKDYLYEEDYDYQVSEGNINMEESVEDVQLQQSFEPVIASKRLRKAMAVQSYKKSKKFVEQDQQIYDDGRMHIQPLPPVITVLNQKRNPLLNYLKQQQNSNKDRKNMQRLQSLQVRRLNVCKQHLNLQIDIFHYLNYLKSLKNAQQISKQIRQVVQQSLCRQERLHDIGMTFKILGLWIMASSPIQYQYIWQSYLQSYILPMLQHQLSINMFASLYQILNNLFVSANNQDLGQLNKLYSYFAIATQILQSYQISLKNKLIQMLYQLMSTPLTPQTPSPYTSTSYITYKSPLLSSQSNLNFSLQPKSKTIALIISSLIFQQTLVKDIAQIPQKSSQQYMRVVTLQLQKRLKWPVRYLYQLVHNLRQYHLTHNPTVNQQYFFKIIPLLDISLLRLMEDNLMHQNQQQTAIHICFLKDIYRQYITSQFQTVGANVNPRQLLNKLTIRTKVKQNYQNPKTWTSIVVYCGVLSVFLEFRPFQQEIILLKMVLKYLRQQLGGCWQSNLGRMNRTLNGSLFSLISQVYNIKLGESMVVQNMMMQLSTKQQQQKYQQIRNIVVKVFNCLDKKYDDVNREIQFSASVGRRQQKGEGIQVNYQKIKGMLEKCQYQISVFMQQLLRLNSKQQEDGMASSVSHFFFVLKFILQQHCFFKYLKSKTSQHLISSVCRLVLKMFRFLPDFTHTLNQYGASNNISLVSNRMTYLLQHYHRSIFQYAISKDGLRKQQQYQFISKIQPNQSRILQLIACIYGMQLISAAQNIDRKRIPDALVFRYVQQSLRINSTSTTKIAKSVYMLSLLHQQITSYLQNRNNYSNIQVHKVKAFIAQHLMLNWTRQTSLCIFMGFALSSCYQFHNIPFQRLIKTIQDSKYIEENSLSTHKHQAYTRFLFSLQQTQNTTSILDTLQQLIPLYLNLTNPQRPLLTKTISNLLLQCQPLLRKIQQQHIDKSFITVQCLRILSFMLTWPQLLTDCIKGYLIQMQIVSKAQSLIGKIHITQNNMGVLMGFFHAVNNMQENPFKIKETMNIYLQSLNDHKMNQQAQLKQARKVCLGINGALQQNPHPLQTAKTFLYKFISKFLHILTTIQSDGNLFFRFQFLLQMLKNSYYQRAIYQQFVSQNWRGLQRIADLYISSKERYAHKCFQDILGQCLMGAYSDLWQCKKLINCLIKQNKNRAEKRKALLSLLTSLNRYASQKEEYFLLVEWCDQQTQQLKKLQELNTWMDIQQSNS